MKDMKLILEGWRGYRQKVMSEVFAAGPEGPAAARSGETGEGLTDAAKVFIGGQELDLHEFVAMLKKVAGDPGFRELALAGETDAGGPDDEKQSPPEGGTDTPAYKLEPTQLDIDMDKSLGDQMTNKYDSTNAALSNDTIMMPSPGGKIPLLVYNNKFILDGHHRWSQIMMTNPKGVVAVQNVDGPAINKPEDALKAVQTAIAALAGNVVTKGTKTNLLDQDGDAIASYVRDKISPEVLKILANAGKISAPDPELAAKYYKDNLKYILNVEPGDFERKLGMPQADDSGVPQADVTAALEKGKINYDAVRASDILTKGRAKPEAEPGQTEEEEHREKRRAAWERKKEKMLQRRTSQKRGDKGVVNESRVRRIIRRELQRMLKG